jgi:hypothetical protein
MEHLGTFMRLFEGSLLREAYSALPDAPVVSDGREPGRVRPHGMRARVASSLLRLAGPVAATRPAARPATAHCGPAR